MNPKEVLVRHLPGLDLHDSLVQRQQISAYGGGEGAESALVFRMPPTGIVERCVWMKEKPHRAATATWLIKQKPMARSGVA